MPVSTATRPVYTHVLFGQPIGEELDAFQLSTDEFEVLGTKVMTHLGRRSSDFKLVTQMFTLWCTAVEELNAFLILEEIAILIEEMDDPRAVELLNRIYHAFNQQVYRDFRAVAHLAS